MKLFKPFLLYTTALSILITLSAVEASVIAYLILLIIDVILVSLCKKTLSLRDLVKYSAYDIIYKSLK